MTRLSDVNVQLFWIRLSLGEADMPLKGGSAKSSSGAAPPISLYHSTSHRQIIGLIIFMYTVTASQKLRNASLIWFA